MTPETRADEIVRWMKRNQEAGGRIGEGAFREALVRAFTRCTEEVEERAVHAIKRAPQIAPTRWR